MPADSLPGNGPNPKPAQRPPSRPTATTCPYCGVRTALSFIGKGELPISSRVTDDPVELDVTICISCSMPMLWLDTNLVYPSSLTGPAPSPDMPSFVHREYDEARHVANDSPRAAAALLRLAIQKLVDQLRPGKGSLDDKIGLLIEDGEIRPKLADMLDIVRVTGNNAAHPGQIDLNEEPERVHTLFQLVNAIVEQTITMDKLVGDAMASLPESDLKGIGDRPKRVQGKFRKESGSRN